MSHGLFKPGTSTCGTNHYNLSGVTVTFSQILETNVVLFNCMLWDSVPDGSLQWSSSFLGWFPWWLRHGAMDPFEGTLLGARGRTELWLYTFNLVIRLRKVKQSAIRFWTIFSRSCCPCHPWDTSANPPLLKWSGTAWNLFLSKDRNGVDNMAFMDHGRLEATCFQVWPTSLHGSLLGLNISCTQFVWIWTAV